MDDELRDKFALRILPSVYEHMIDMFQEDCWYEDKCSDIADAVYALADELIAARKRYVTNRMG